ncbi:hypothetical protein Tco_0480935 [Tanacetum coccineum]|uniref:Uncharacterized protein n=1 Tax=Tanacetum coccineum TaxID=301880 RepID=A0ABQ5EIU3_9ASTR
MMRSDVINIPLKPNLGRAGEPLTEDRPSTPEPAWTIPSFDLSMPTNNWASALKLTYAPPQENSLLAQTGDMATFMDWYCKQRGISELTPKDLEGPAFEIVKVFHHDVQRQQAYSTGRPALSISKMKAAYYPDVGLEQLVPDQFWIVEECKYDIAAMYDISHWWVQRQRFYIDQFSSEGDRRAVRTHMRILSVVRIEVFSMYGYNYIKKIVLRRADLKEYVIAKGLSNTCTPSDFEDLYLLNLQDQKLGFQNRGQPQKTSQLGIEELPDTLNSPNSMGSDRFEFKHDLYSHDSPRASYFRDRNEGSDHGRFMKYTSSDGTLQQLKRWTIESRNFQINRTNPGMNTRFWTKKDVDRSKDFMFAIQKRLKTRRIFQNLESFVGGQIREGGHRLAEEIPNEG